MLKFDLLTSLKDKEAVINGVGSREFHVTVNDIDYTIQIETFELEDTIEVF